MSIAPSGATLVKPPLLGSGASAGQIPIVGQVPAVIPYLLTVGQVEAMVRAGILTENDRCELIRGELIKKMVLGDSHVAAVRRLNHWFSRLANDRFIVGVQDTVKLIDSLPEPDVTLLRHRADFYSNQTAAPVDVLLLVEVADSSLDYDRNIKLPLYAENGIGEYWIVNLVGDCVEVHRQPQLNGTYAERRVASRGEQLSPTSLPSLVLTVDEILGPRTAS